MDPVAALRQIAFYKNRAREESRRVMAYRNAADVVEALDDAAREKYGKANSWQTLPGIGPKTAAVIAQAWAGREPDVLIELRSTAGDLGGGDQEPELLERLDVVVAGVHSKLKMESAAMTRRMVRAVSEGYADVLGHCTGRLVTGGRGTRPESQFDAEKVFTACRDNGTAVEINSRPERRDPPTRLLKLAMEIGCDFSIDTDAHARPAGLPRLRCPARAGQRRAR